LLKLNCDKALFQLKWQPTLSYQETVEYVGDWYASYYKIAGINMALETSDQITNYEQKAVSQKLVWAQ
jgi:CDP-glucose 4,6-dehydratase